MAGVFSTLLDSVAGRFGFIRAKPEEIVDWQQRGQLYAVNELLYDNRVYLTRRNGGALEDVLATYLGRSGCNPAQYPIVGHFSPYKEIVDVYQNCIPGAWGEDVKIADEVNGKKVNAPLVPALEEVWRASNFDTEKQKLMRWAANYGTVGIRIVATTTDDDKQRVSLRIDHPKRLLTFEEDSEGNVTAVSLKWNDRVNRGTLEEPQFEDVEVLEVFTKDEFSQKRDGDQVIPEMGRRNNLGFCPYVILRHKDNGTPYGDWAYKGIEGRVHSINYRLTRQDRAVDRNDFPKWFGGGAGDAPESVDLGDGETMQYVKLDPESPNPFLMPIVANLQTDKVLLFTLALRDMVRESNPELNLHDMKLISGVSGETLQQVKVPVEDKVKQARALYLHSVKRGLQMGVSAGIEIGLFTDIGASTGDEAFNAGLEDFDFEPMPLLPITPSVKLILAQAQQAEQNEKLKTASLAQSAGFDEQGALEHVVPTAKAKEILNRKRKNDVVPVDEQ